MNIFERVTKNFLGDNAQELRQVYRTVKSRAKWFRHGYPTDVIIEVTSRCNSECRYCPRMQLILDGEITIAGMSGFTLERIIEELKTCPDLQTIILAGYGEPLLYPKLVEAIKLLKTEFPLAKIRVVTNGIALTEDLGMRIIDSRLDQVIVSLNYWNRESYHAQTGVDKINVVVENIKKFLLMKGNQKPCTWIQIFDVDKTHNQIEDFKRFWSCYLNDNDKVFVQGFHSYGGKVSTQDYDSTLRPRRYPCLQLWQHILITHEGKVYPCCAGVTGICIGNVNEQSLQEIVNGKRLEYFRRLHLDNHAEKIPACRDCDFWARYRNPFVRIGNRWI